MQRQYLCIDLKSFYASVECAERGLDPMTTNLVVADPERTDKTICLAVSPSMKALGVRNRCRVFEIPKHIRYIMAPPRMQKYIDYSAQIYCIYLRYVAKEDIHVYSIDECFLDVTEYLSLYRLNARQMAQMLMDKVASELGIRATAGIGSNLYLAKIALDITAKHSPDFIGELDEESYISTLWDHRPITDFWRVGRGTAERLSSIGISTMGQLANAREDTLYDMFGIDAELLIDHAWGRESCTIADIKAYKPKSNCLSSGQVLMRDYSFSEARLIVKEMADILCQDLVSRKMLTSNVSLMVGFASSSAAHPVSGAVNLEMSTDSSTVITEALLGIYDRIVEKKALVRRIGLGFNDAIERTQSHQLSLFEVQNRETLEKNRKIQEAVLNIKSRYGKNSMLKAMDLEEAATTRERNRQIGGHRSGEN